MLEIMFRVLTSWQVIAVSLLLLLLLILFIPRSKPGRNSNINRSRIKNFKQKMKTGIKIETAQEQIAKEKSGKLYVSDSTYKMLKKEKRIHPPPSR